MEREHESEKSPYSSNDDLGYLFKVQDPPRWADGGAVCREVGPYLWDAPAYSAEAQQAKALCNTCPLQKACLAYAMDPRNDISWGTWGGWTTAERTAGHLMKAPVFDLKSDVVGVRWANDKQAWVVTIKQKWVAQTVSKELAEAKAREAWAAIEKEEG